MKKRWLLTPLLCSLILACSDSSSSSNNSNSSKRDMALALSIDNNIYIGTGSLDDTDNLGNDFIESGMQAGFTVYDNAIYIMVMDAGTITRYPLNEDNEMESASGKLNLGANSAANHIFFASGQKAYIGSMTDSLIIINPTTMKKTGSIDLGKYKSDNATTVTAASGVIVDGLLYITLLQSQSMYIAGDTAMVAVIDVEKDSIIAIAKDARISAVGSIDDCQNGHITVADDGYIYFYGNASWGYATGHRDGFLRIKKGETEFDPDYCFRVSDEIALDGLTKKGNYKYLMTSAFAEGTTIYSNMTLLELSTNMEDFYQYICKPVKIDLAKKTVEALPMNLNTSYSAFFIYVESDTSVIYGLSTKEDGSGYFRYNPKTDEAEMIAKLSAGLPMWGVPLD